MFLKALSVTLLAAVLATQAFGFGAPEHSAVEVTNQKQGDSQQFVVKVVPKNNMVVNFDAPWKLEIQEHDGLTIAKTTFAKADMDEKLPGFTFAAKAAKPDGAMAYNATVFICTKDKTQCFREVHKAKTTWTLAK